MTRGKASLVLGLALIASASVASAQSPHLGMVTCSDCTAVSDLPTAALFAFKLGNVSAITQPDVLFDERRVGGMEVGGAAAPEPGTPLWSLAPNWRQLPTASDDVYAIILEEGVAFIDSSSYFTQDMGLETMQALCSYPGSMAPRVSVVGPNRVIEWADLIELNDVPLPNECTLGGAEVRGHVIGYNIYRLDASSSTEPPRRDFVTMGGGGHADLSRLNFGVVDMDGNGGSDLDASDGLKLRNPDGLPDTGDEVLMYTDGGRAAGDYWYRVQPVVAGSQSFYDSGLTGSASIPATRVDLDGDGTRESVDIGRDGFLEFIDPSGRGLGLTWGGEIASSYHAGRGEPGLADPGCDGQPPPAPGESECANGVDDDGDTLADCLDAADCCGAANCLASPAEVARVDVARPFIGSRQVLVSWIPGVAPPPAGAVSDVLCGCISRRPTAPNPRAPGCLWQDRGTASASCLADDEPGLALADAREIDPVTMGYYYLVREQSACGVAGTFGRDSRGAARVTGPASCSP